MEILIYTIFFNSYMLDYEEISMNAKSIGIGKVKSLGENFYLSNPSLISYNNVGFSYAGTALFSNYSLTFTKMGEKSGFGTGVTFIQIPDFVYTELPDTTLPPGESNEPIPVDTASFMSFLAQFSIMRNLSSYFSVGLNLKTGFYTDLKRNAVGGGIDLGLLYHKDDMFQIGLFVKNLVSFPYIYSSSNRKEYQIPRIYTGFLKKFQANEKFELFLISEFGILPEMGNIAQFSFLNAGISPTIALEIEYNSMFGIRFGYLFSDFTIGFDLNYKKINIGYGLSTTQLSELYHTLSFEVKL